MAFGIAPPVSAQVVNFRHYTNVEGLPQAQVLGIHQDRRGYLWFATYGGVSRFNGDEFQTYTTDHGLSSNSTFDITEDGRGRLLVATSGGLCIMEAERFQCIRERDGLASDNARSLAVDAAGDIWVGSAQGLSRVRDREVRTFGRDDGLPSERINRIAVDSGGRLWVATEQGLARYDGTRFITDTTASLATAVRFVVPFGSKLLIGTQDGLFVRSDDGLARIAAHRIGSGSMLVDGAVDRDGAFWLATRAGGMRVKGDQVDAITRTNGLLTDLVNRVAIDREGDVWFGTESGASKHVPGPFSTYTEDEGLPNVFVRAIELDDRGRLWAGTRDGVAVLDGNTFRSIDLSALPDTRVFGLAHVPGNGLLIGTRRGLAHWNGRLIRHYTTKDGLPGDVVYCLLPDPNGGFWLGTDRGLARWDGGRVTHVDRPELNGIGFISIASDQRGRIWLGRLSGGVAILDGDSVTLMGPADGLTDQTVWSLAQDAHDRMWVGTNGDGVLRIDGAGIARFTEDDGLASNFIWQILPDSRGDIWLYGNNGLDRFTGNELTHYGKGSGLIELEGSANAAHEDARGDLWFGTGSGVVRYMPGLDVAPVVRPPVYIEGATRDGEPLSLSDPRLRLRGGVLRVDFASPSFRDESALRYRYRLVGASGSWSVPTQERSITWAGLGPGHYRLEVVAANRGLESEEPATFAFTVLPAFWQTWWFRVLGLLVVGGATAVMPTLRARGLERERRRLEALVAHHTRELADKNARLQASNRDLEHFAYVASHDLQEPLRKIQAFSDRVTRQYATAIDDQGRDYLARMSSAAARMQRLIEDLLSLSRVSTRKNPPARIDLRALTHEVLGDLEIRIKNTNGRVELGELPTITGDPVQLRQLLQNLIGNALKFHRPDEPPVVRVHGRQRDPTTIELRVEDNGIGFENKDADRVFLPFQRLHNRQQYEGTGIGLTICQKIVERHGGTIQARSTPGTGTQFIITLPVDGLIGERHAA